MEFPGFIGNQGVKNQLSAAFDSGAPFHAYLITGPEGCGKRTLAGIVSAALQCQSDKAAPCMACAQCRKAVSLSHPDVTAIQSDKQSIPVELIRKMRSDAYIMPNEGKKKIYIIPEAERLGPASQNAMLKILEEPPDYAVFLLLAENPEALLETLRSRCVELKLAPLTYEQTLRALRERFGDTPDAERAAGVCGGCLGAAIRELEGGGRGRMESEADEFINAFYRSDETAMMKTAFSLDKLKKDELAAFFRQVTAGLHKSMKTGGRSGGLDPRRLLCAIEVSERCLEYVNSNVGAGHVLGYLCAGCRDILRSGI